MPGVSKPSGATVLHSQDPKRWSKLVRSKPWEGVEQALALRCRYRRAPPRQQPQCLCQHMQTHPLIVLFWSGSCELLLFTGTPTLKDEAAGLALSFPCFVSLHDNTLQQCEINLEKKPGFCGSFGTSQQLPDYR